MSGVAKRTAMLDFLVITESFPQADQAFGDLRFFILPGSLAQHHGMTLCPLNAADQKKQLSNDAFASSKQGSMAQGVPVADDLQPLLHKQPSDAVPFEFYQPTIAMLNVVNFRQPSARALVDSVDVHFRRFAAKQALTGEASDPLMADHLNNHDHALRLINDCRAH